jgi:hypothetical protein
VRGTEWQSEELHQIFRVARGERQVKANGYIRFRHWDLYGERGLARHHVAVWLSADVTTVTIEYAHEPLAQYTAAPVATRTRFKDVTLLHLFENHFHSPQLLLWEPNAVEWRLALPRPTTAFRRLRELHRDMQPPLFPPESTRAVTG